MLSPERYTIRERLRIAPWRALAFLLVASSLTLKLIAVDFLPPGHRPLPPGVHALVGAKVVTQPGQVLENASIVIRDGRFEAVGTNVILPADARIWQMQGHTIYAGFIDIHVPASSKAETPSTTENPTDALTSGKGFYGVSGQTREPGKRAAGHDVAKATPERRVAETLSPDPKALEALREIGFTVANFVPAAGILRGTSALAALSDSSPNDAILRADVFQHATLAVDLDQRGVFPSSLMGVIALVRQTFADARHYRADHADWQKRPTARKRPEFNPALDALGGVIDRKVPLVIEPRNALIVDRSAHVARELGIDFLMVSSGQEWRRSEIPGSVSAPFIVPVNFPEIPKLPDDDDWHQVSLDQLRVWDWAPENAAVLRKAGREIALTTFNLGEKKNFRRNVRLSIERGLDENDALAALTTVPARLCGAEQQLGTIAPGKLANLTVVEGNSYFDPEAKVRAVWIDGKNYTVSFDKPKAAASTAPDAAAKSKEKKDAREPLKKRTARSPQEGRAPLASPKTLLIHNASLWTCADAGRIERGYVLIVDGRISAVGAQTDTTALPAAELVIDAGGKHVSPGIIDCHSHALVLGGVNEGSVPSSAMVRIGDVVNSETENIYQQLAGGVTTINLLHGSANPIGAHNAVLKLKEGAAPDELKVADAPGGIKFALGENVKQSNWGERFVTRFPQTRMGVRTFIANRFMAAQAYVKEHERFKREGGVPPRHDLELETIAEILSGKRLIHCHSYRQDEILAFLRLMESFGVRIGTLQHILEGYKVADEIAAHGAGASAFSDWWAYKFEVYDAIPYAGSLMRDRGVLVSFNSDDADLARRLYLEAAKAVKYGGTPEIEALKFVTLNPAKQLRIDHRLGSLTPGKDGDFVIWSTSPLDSSTVCLETWIEGKKYFDRSRDAERVSARATEWQALVDKAKKLTSGSSGAARDEKAEAAFFEVALEHLHDRLDRHCDDE